MVKNRILKPVLFFLLLGWNLAGFAAEADPLYQIEIIVYSHITNEALQSEYWPALPPLVIPPTTLELADSQIVPPSHISPFQF